MNLFHTSSLTRENFFITSIDDFSQCGYVYLLNDKSQIVNVHEVFVKEVER